MAAATAVLTPVLSAILLHRGVILSPDGWAYWEGSVSILKGLGYRYFGGQEITDFPPLFPVFLAVWQWFFGISGRALAMALLFLGALSAGVWALLFQRALPHESSWVQRGLLGVYFPTFFAAYYRSLLSETLLLLLLGLMCLLMTRAVAESLAGRRVLLLSAGVGLLSTLLLFCRNSAIAFLALQVYRTATFVRGSLRGDYRPPVGPNVTISPDWIDKPTKSVGARILVSPPDYPWIDRGLG